jgi:hypothetical protein
MSCSHRTTPGEAARNQISHRTEALAYGTSAER